MLKYVDKLFGWWLYDDDGKATNGMYAVKLLILVLVIVAAVAEAALLIRGR